MSAAPEPVSDEAIEDLRRRSRAARLVAAPGEGWSRGVDHDHLRGLLRYWAEEYDWRAAEARIRGLPWVRAGGLRLLEQRGPEGAPVVVLLHGWPDSVLRFERVLPLLRELTVVVPALPGYPFSGSSGAASVDMATPIRRALGELGHERYVVSGGDIGTGVAIALALQDPEGVRAVHLTDVPDRVDEVPEADRTPDERALQEAVAHWYRTEGGYEIEQSTRPSTLAAGLGDSPAGLAAWIVEKLRAWSDCDGEVERAFPRDDLLTWISSYWFSSAIGTSFTAYSEHRPVGAGRPAAPVAVSVFPKDLIRVPREHAERFLDVRDWVEEPSGGHFAAWERPDAFAAAIRRTVALAE